MNEFTDSDLENSLLELLNNTKYEMYTFHGEMLDEWYENKEAGPLLIIMFQRLLVDNFVEQLDQLYPQTTIFSMLLDATGPDAAAYLVIISHKNFHKIGLYGQELTPEQFSEQLEIAQAYKEQ